MFDFTEEELNRYSRHILLQDVGVEGQEKIREGKVLVIGAGGLGAPVAMYLAAAGVGTIGIVDGDVVDLSNLQRQIIHTTPDVDKWKVESAKETINAINPHVKVNTYREFLMSDNALDIVKDYNNQEECQPIIRKSMMLATHYDASMWMVLHENRDIGSRCYGLSARIVSHPRRGAGQSGRATLRGRPP